MNRSKQAGMAIKTIVVLLVGLALASVRLSEAQQAGKVYRIGFLSGGFPGPTHWTAKLTAQLQQIGYIEGKNLIIESRFTENKIDRLPALADELVRLKVDLIATGGINDARAAKNATKTIPIVGLSLGDPVANGLVESLARPGGNLTGFTTISDELAGKRLELLKEIIPNLSRVALLWNSQFPDSVRAWKQYQATARELSLQLHSMEVTSPDKFEPAFKEFDQGAQRRSRYDGGGIYCRPRQSETNSRSGGKVSPARDIRSGRLYRQRRLDVLRRGRFRTFQACRRVYRQDSQGQQTL